MRIDDPNAKGLPPGGTIQGPTQSNQTSRAARSNPYAGQQETSGVAGDQIELSSLAGKLSELQTDSPERAKRLEKLALEVQSGRYQVDSAELSRRIVDDAIQSGNIHKP